MTDEPQPIDLMLELLVILIGAAIICSLALAYALSVKASMPPPGVEIPLPEKTAPDFDAAWEGIPVPPFHSSP